MGCCDTPAALPAADALSHAHRHCSAPQLRRLRAIQTLLRHHATGAVSLTASEGPAAAATAAGATGAAGAVEAAAAGPALAPTTPIADLGGCQLDRAAYAAHRLTPAERAQFQQQGWLLVPAALTVPEIAALTAALDAEHERKLQEPTDPSHPDAMNRMAVFSPANRLGHSPAVQGLLTCPAVFPKIVDILGWNIGVYHAHGNRSPPPAPGDTVLRDGQFRPVELQGPDGAVRTHGFHQDGRPHTAS